MLTNSTILVIIRILYSDFRVHRPIIIHTMFSSPMVQLQQAKAANAVNEMAMEIDECVLYDCAGLLFSSHSYRNGQPKHLVPQKKVCGELFSMWPSTIRTTNAIRVNQRCSTSPLDR